MTLIELVMWLWDFFNVAFIWLFSQSLWTILFLLIGWVILSAIVQVAKLSPEEREALNKKNKGDK